MASCRRTRILLNTDFKDVQRDVGYRWLIYTGSLDTYYDQRFGKLPYRSLRLEPESFEPDQLMDRRDFAGRDGFWQPIVQVNYPDSEDFTRIVEIKHATGQDCPNTTIVRECPEDSGEPFYPIPAPDTAKRYQQYRELADHEPNASFIGRLARYKYYNMDQVVAMALKEFARLREEGALAVE